MEECKIPKKNLKFLEFDFGEKKLFIFKDHAVAIKCLKKAFNDKIIKKNNLLIHIDHHADLCSQEKNLEKSKKILEMHKKELDNFIQNLFFNNSELIIPLFYSKLIDDCVSIHETLGSPDAKEIKEEFGGPSEHLLFNKDGLEHKFFKGGNSIKEVFSSHHGVLGDKCMHKDIISLYNTKEIILDIDLDFFTYFKDKTFAQNKRNIKDQINSISFQNLFNKAKIILIALEPKCCGGEEDCLEILKVFQEEIFNKFNLKVYNKVKEEFFKNEN